MDKFGDDDSADLSTDASHYGRFGGYGGHHGGYFGGHRCRCYHLANGYGMPMDQFLKRYSLLTTARAFYCSFTF